MYPIAMSSSITEPCHVVEDDDDDEHSMANWPLDVFLRSRSDVRERRTGSVDNEEFATIYEMVKPFRDALMSRHHPQADANISCLMQAPVVLVSKP